MGVPLLDRSVRGVALTDAGKVFLDHARLALSQVDAAVEAARRAAQPTKQKFALGFLTGQEMRWLPCAMGALRDTLATVDVTVSSDYSPDLAQAVARGQLDLAFMRAEPGFALSYLTVAKEKLVELMPSDHALASQASVSPQDPAGEAFIAMANRAKVLRSIVDAYLAAADVNVKVAQNVDNPAMVMSLVASTRGVTVIADYVQNLMPWSVVSRPLHGTVPTIDLVVAYRKSNPSPTLRCLLSRLDEVMAGAGQTA